MKEFEIIAIVIKGAMELLSIAKEWLGGSPPTPERVEAAWAQIEQVKAKILTDALERERYGDTSEG